MLNITDGVDVAVGRAQVYRNLVLCKSSGDNRYITLVMLLCRADQRSARLQYLLVY